MTKLLILFLLGWLVWRLLRPAGSRRSAYPPTQAPARTPAGERMRACAHCGLNVPESEMVQAGGLGYCCDEHLRLGPSASPGDMRS